MLKKLCPKLKTGSVWDLDLFDLKSRGIQGIIFDLDNTLVKWNQDILAPEIIATIKQAKQMGFKLSILSNALEHRVEAVADLLGIPYVSRAVKPRKSPFRKAMELMGTTQETTAVVGDQLFTDILGGNRMKLYTIWTSPLSTTEFISTRAVRKIERLVVKRFRKKGILK
ncbi:MAG: YqeG family HAD IIIA-type phosphatase [Bacillota bacterium]|jgi:HAD superfamily phosphatase (TIGR01668 family)